MLKLTLTLKSWLRFLTNACSENLENLSWTQRLKQERYVTPCESSISQAGLNSHNHTQTWVMEVVWESYIWRIAVSYARPELTEFIELHVGAHKTCAGRTPQIDQHISLELEQPFFIKFFKMIFLHTWLKNE